MPQVFISYASRDAIFADLAKVKLDAAGIQVWLDQGALRAGAEWRKAIDEGIQGKEATPSNLATLVISSPDFQRR